MAGEPAATRTGAPPQVEPEIPEGVFHVVRPGQTLWRIARAYGLPLETLVDANEIADPDRLSAGRALFVPGGRTVLEVAPYPVPLPAPSSRRGAPSGDSAREREFSWPIAGAAVLSRFGAARRGRRHTGLDIRGPRGAQILAARAGVVVFSGPTANGYGRVVVIDHEDGFQTIYAHNERELVQVGQRVGEGEPIALVGRTGNATTDHCHFEIRKDREPVDPLPFLTSVTRASR